MKNYIHAVYSLILAYNINLILSSLALKSALFCCKNTFVTPFSSKSIITKSNFASDSLLHKNIQTEPLTQS